MNLSLLFDRIQSLCETNNIKISELEIILGFSKNLIYKWKNSNPRCDKLEKVADYFDVSIDYLIGKTYNPLSHKDNLEPSLGMINSFRSALDNISKAEADIKYMIQVYQQQNHSTNSLKKER